MEVSRICRAFFETNVEVVFTQIDLTSGFHQIPIAEKDKPKTAFRDADGQLHEFNRAGFGLTALPAVFTWVVKRALAPPLRGVEIG